MDPIPGLKGLLERKRDLLLESDLNRQAIRLELARLRMQGERWRSGLTRGYSWWNWLAPVAGFLVARKLSKTSGAVAKGSLVASLVGAAWKIWNARRSTTSPDLEPKP
jgi:hypothetical protein